LDSTSFFTFVKKQIMSNDAIKLELIQWLTFLNDEETINYLKVVKDSQEKNADWWNLLTEEQKAGIERGLQDIEDGRIHSHEEVKTRYGF